MEKLRRTKSGWETRVYLGRDIHGKKITRRVSGPDAREVRMEAARLELERNQEMTGGETFQAAAEKLIESREAVLSPSTIRGYRSYLRRLERDYSGFTGKRLKSITRSDLQQVVNGLVDDGSAPKSVDNIYLFIAVVLRQEDIIIRGVVLPRREPPNLNIPDEATVRRTIEAVRDTELYVPVLLAAFGPMRRGEICALQISDISGDVIHVQRGMIWTGNEWIIKPPKSYTSNRRLRMPEDVMDAVRALSPGEDGRLIPYNPNQLSDKFRRALKRAGIPRYRFHDLRHFCASYLHARGVPDIYIQQRTGHASAAVLRQVYTHTMTDQDDRLTAEMLGWFDDMIQA